MAVKAIALINRGDIDLDGVNHEGKTPVYMAVQERQRGITAALLQAKANITKPSVFGKTPLHVAAGSSNPWFTQALLAAGAATGINQIDCLGRTPLHYAAWHGHPDNAGLLLDAEANPSLPDSSGRTPLDMALQELGDFDGELVTGTVQAIKRLLQAGAKDGHAVLPENRSGLPAPETREALSYLLRFACDQPEQDVELITLLLQQPGVYHPHEGRGNTEPVRETASYRNYRTAIGKICRKRKIFPFDRPYSTGERFKQ